MNSSMYNGTEPDRRGSILIVALVTLIIIMLTAAALMRSIVVVHRQSRSNQQQLQAEWLADAAVSRAAARLAAEPDYRGETWQPQISPADTEHGLAEIRIEPAARSDSKGPGKITVLAHFPDHEWHRASASREISITPEQATRENAAAVESAE